MKNSFIIFVSLLCLSLGTTLQAQRTNSDFRQNATFGIRAGFNYSNVWDESGQDFSADAKVGFAGGAFLALPIGEVLGIQPEILISQKGFQGSGTLLGSSYSFSRTTTYIDIPIQLQVKPSDAFTVLAGPHYSYLMSEKNVYTLGPNSYEQSQQFDNDNIRKNIFGFIIGGDVYLQQIVISGRLGWDLQTNNGDGTSTTPRYKNQWLQLTLGFRF